MKIVLYDLLATSGHHISYATYLIRYFREQGDEVLFVAWAPDPHGQKLPKQGEDFSIHWLGKRKTDTTPPPLPSTRSAKKWLHASRSMVGLKHCSKYANQWNADIVHYLYLDRSELFLRLQSIDRSNTKHFATLFWPYFIHDEESLVPLSKRLYHWTNRCSLRYLLKTRKLDRLFVHSERIKRLLIQSLGREIKDRIFVIPDPIEPSVNKLTRAEVRKQLGLPNNMPLLLFFGGLRRDKGPDILLKALQLPNQHDYSLVIAGRPSDIDQSEVEQYQSKLANPNQLIPHLKFIPDEEVESYFTAADVVVLPYRKVFKGTSGVLQRAAAAGKPIIATNIGDIGPTVQENKLGIVVEPESPEALANGIRQFLVQQEEWSQQVKPRAFKYAQDHHWRKMAKRVREAYLDVVGR